MGCVRGLGSLLTLVVHSAKWAIRWPNELCFSIDDPPRKGGETGSDTEYLGSLYARLDECVANAARSLGRYDVVTYANSSFLQMFLWEHFGALEYATVPRKARGLTSSRGAKSRYRGRPLRWQA